MATITKRANRLMMSETGEQIIIWYKRRFRTEEGLTAVTIRNYLSKLRHFATWRETTWRYERKEQSPVFPGIVTPSILTGFPICLQQELHFKPNSLNCSMLSPKCSFAWPFSTKQSTYDPLKETNSLSGLSGNK